jgi:hypothetical protein
MTRASIVFPVPGSPVNRTPLTGFGAHPLELVALGQRELDELACAPLDRFHPGVVLEARTVGDVDPEAALDLGLVAQAEVDRPDRGVGEHPQHTGRLANEDGVVGRVPDVVGVDQHETAARLHDRVRVGPVLDDAGPFGFGPGRVRCRLQVRRCEIQIDDIARGEVMVARVVPFPLSSTKSIRPV